MRALIAATALPVLMFALAHAGRAAGPHTRTSEPFAGVKANTGTVTHSTEGGRSVLTLSDDFKVPDTPDPHWQVVDSTEGLDPLGDGLRLVYYDHTTSPSIAPPWPRASRGARARAAPRNGLI